MRADKTLSELWDLADDVDFGDVARMAIRVIKEQQEEIRQYEYALKNIAYSTFKGNSFEKMAREFAKEATEK